jgi:hypothetical protein
MNKPSSLAERTLEEGKKLRPVKKSFRAIAPNTIPVIPPIRFTRLGTSYFLAKSRCFCTRERVGQHTKINATPKQRPVHRYPQKVLNHLSQTNTARNAQDTALPNHLFRDASSTSASLLLSISSPAAESATHSPARKYPSQNENGHNKNQPGRARVLLVPV